MSSSKNSPAHVGSASILLIFAVLAIISFATLTLVNSKADYNLSSSLADRQKAYYNACHEGNAFVASVNSGFCLNQNDDIIVESVPISDNQTLDIAIMLNNADNSDNTYTITQWQVVNHDEFEYDNTLPVLKEND